MPKNIWGEKQNKSNLNIVQMSTHQRKEADNKLFLGLRQSYKNLDKKFK